MSTKVFLIRHGTTPWHAEKRVLGQRDVPLSDEGIEQANAVATRLAGMRLADVISSPLQRAVQTAEIIGRRFEIQVARDPRLTDFALGKWSGMTYEEVDKNAEYRKFLANPVSERIPGGENLTDIRDRATSAIEQAIEDSPSGDAIAVVTHAGIIRVILSHYLGSNPANYHRIRVSPGSISVLSFVSERELPRVLAINMGPNLAEITHV